MSGWLATGTSFRSRIPTSRKVANLSAEASRRCRQPRRLEPRLHYRVSTGLPKLECPDIGSGVSIVRPVERANIHPDRKRPGLLDVPSQAAVVYSFEWPGGAGDFQRLQLHVEHYVRTGSRSLSFGRQVYW